MREFGTTRDCELCAGDDYLEQGGQCAIVVLRVSALVVILSVVSMALVSTARYV
ncbi:predicted protein [Sclerotinia sclerotiorum 1980 UF-70]|uniref:Uncharacterized protein n=1 Tax=Sclerotinia sclerotiorum (strain ATCC 18683 / 1980 / Ss-1) TaxID=665079 RepID=A7ER04_SCLS1|nr:predicted protein [Sclerotinia sclerotiorum 1980 UF-70]EDN91896.1 predicted protein [Sclerotinia sclerotiorum 1980 UF-70]